MLALIAALAASAQSPVLETSVPWWERITVTVDDKGKQQSCRYQISLLPTGAKACDEATAASIGVGKGGKTGALSKLTFERRFSPGGQLDDGQLQPGDELLGRKVLFLTIDANGAIGSCQEVASTGDMQFQYDCEAARKEQFRAPAITEPGSRQAFMTVLAYGHSEQIA